MEIPRIVTEREIFDEEYLSLHKTCMEIAIQESQELAKQYNIPIENFDISALTYQHFRLWLDRKEYIKTLAKEKQKQLDK